MLTRAKGFTCRTPADVCNHAAGVTVLTCMLVALPSRAWLALARFQKRRDVFLFIEKHARTNAIKSDALRLHHPAQRRLRDAKSRSGFACRFQSFFCFCHVRFIPYLQNKNASVNVSNVHRSKGSGLLGIRCPYGYPKIMCSSHHQSPLLFASDSTSENSFSQTSNLSLLHYPST